MGSGISYIYCCNNRKKSDEKEEKPEKIEEASPTSVLQPSAAEEKGSISPQARPLIEEKVSPLTDNEITDKENKKEVDLEMKSRHLSSKGNFIVKVFVDYLEVTYKLCDDFGSYFKPFVEIVFEHQKKVLYQSDEKLNTSNFSDNAGVNNNNNDTNNSFNMNNISGIERLKSKPINSSTGKERYYPFKIEEIFTGNKDSSYFPIYFIVKNTNMHKSLTSAHPSITVGECSIRINMIYILKEGEFEGFLRIKNRGIQEIGKLKVKIMITDKNAASFVVKNKNDLDNSLNMNNSLDMNMMYKQIEYWEDELTNYYEIEPIYHLYRYFFFETLKFKERNLLFANKIIIEKVYDANTLYKYYLQTVKDDNAVAIYQILNQLIKLSLDQDFNTIHEFFKFLGQEKSEWFFKIPDTTIYNVYIIERFMMFLYYSQKYFNNNKSLTIRINKFWNETSVVDIVYKCMKRLFLLYKQNSYDYLYLLQVRECIIWCLNNLNELLTQPVSAYDSSDELLNAEYTMIYNNSIGVMSHRISWLKLIDVYSVDSQIMSGLFRVFRKATQMITNDSSLFLDRSRIQGRPKDISKKLKLLLIEEYEGLFLYSLKLMLQKYQHYPELHVNILIILFQITSFIEYNHLIFTAKKIGLKDFCDNFMIYRGKLKVFSKLLNNLHLNVLANFSEITKIDSTINGKDLKEYENCLIEIIHDFNKFYSFRNNSSKKHDDFIINKQEELGIHEIVLRLYSNLARSDILFKELIKEKEIFIDIMDNLNKFSGHYKSKDNKEYVRYLLEKNKKNIDELRKSIIKIIEYSVLVLRNLLQRARNNIEEFKNFLSNLSDLYTKDYIKSLLSSCVKNLKQYQIFSIKLDDFINETKILIEDFWI